MKHVAPVIVFALVALAGSACTSASPHQQAAREPYSSPDAGRHGDAGVPGAPKAGDDPGGGGPGTPPPAPTVWPNDVSWANSDTWIADHHDTITEMHPKVLAVNFIDDPQGRARFASNMQSVADVLKEGSRYHGYGDPSAAPFLSFEITKMVDLADDVPPPGWNHRNSSRYPLKCDANAPYQFDYGALFGDAFAQAYGMTDPADPSRGLGLCELVDKGMVHEVWLHVDGTGDPYTCPNGVQMNDFQLLEVLEAKPKYDAQGQKTGDWDACAGNGCFASDDFTIAKACGRSVRIVYVNGTRGPGCAVHSLGHGFESTARGGTIPYLAANFPHFANFNLKTRLGMPVDDFYPCGDNCVSFTSPNSFDWNVNGASGSVDTYDQGCGSVHFPPNARSNYDDQNDYGVLSTCEHYGMKGGPGGVDQPEIYTNAKSQMYDALAPDCGGGWQVYWRQSFPGAGNAATGADGAPMKNWWPYLFY